MKKDNKSTFIINMLWREQLLDIVYQVFIIKEATTCVVYYTQVTWACEIQAWNSLSYKKIRKTSFFHAL